MIFGYIRSATNNEEKLNNQGHTISEYCKEHKLNLDVLVKGNGIDTEVSNELQSVLDVLTDGDIIIVSDIARIVRNAEKCFNVINDINNKNAKIIIIN